VTELRDRIVRHARVDPNDLTVNPKNWRGHPSHQQKFLGGVMDQIGWVEEVMVNEHTGTIIDGHLRVALAISRGESSVPVRYVDLTEEDEALVLATLDPLTSMATTDQDKLDDLLLETQAGNDSVEALLEMLASKSEDELRQPGASGPELEEWGVVVMCSSRTQQDEMLDKLRSEGLICRAL